MKKTEASVMAKMREDWENGHRELEAKYEARLNELKSDLELRRKVLQH
jgi:hypothetical protein